jgi:Glutathione peroxidase
MLRKGVPTGVPTKRHDEDGKEGDEKGGKVKRQTKERVKSTLLFLFLFASFGLGALYVFQDSTDFDPLGAGGYLRAARVLKKAAFFRNPSMLPPDSIYHLSVDDCNGEHVNLEQYSGSVSLIVNVASQ